MKKHNRAVANQTSSSKNNGATWRGSHITSHFFWEVIFGSTDNFTKYLHILFNDIFQYVSWKYGSPEPQLKKIKHFEN